MSIYLNSKTCPEDLLEFLHDMGTPYLIGSDSDLNPGDIFYIGHQPFHILRRSSEEEVICAYKPRLRDKYEIEDSLPSSFMHYYEVSSD